MRSVNHERSKFIGTLMFLLMFCVGIGYAALTEKLNIEQAINYDSMKWDVGFVEALDNGGTVVSTPVISQDKKTISLSCSIGSTSESQTCIAIATIKNGGTFDVELASDPTITFDENYVESVDVTLDFNGEKLNTGHTLYSGFEEVIVIKATTKELTKESMPSNATTISIALSINWVERAPREMITFSIKNKGVGTAYYQAEKGMTLIEWAYSPYNTSGDYTLRNSRTCTTDYLSNDNGQFLMGGATFCNSVIKDQQTFTLEPL